MTRRLLPLLAAVAGVGALLCADALARAARTSPTAEWARPLAAAVVIAGAVLYLRKATR